MALCHLILLQLMVLLLPIKSSSQNCQQYCGNVYVSYPFGIGEECYFDKSFEVTCDNSSGSSRAFLTSSNLELFEADDYPSGTVGVNISNSMSNIKTSIATIFKQSGKHLSFSNKYNRLVAIGCEEYNIINKIYSKSINSTDRCLSISTCDPTKNDGCFTFICPIPPHHNFDEANNKTQGCKSSFVADGEWFRRNYLANTKALIKHKDDEPVPIRLEWGKYRGRCAEPYNSSRPMNCSKDNYCMMQLSSNHYCRCFGQTFDSFGGCTGALICIMTSDNNCAECPFGYRSGVSDPYDTRSQEPERRCSTSRRNDEFVVKKSRNKFFIFIGREEEIINVADLTRRCLNLNGKKRPTMRVVASELAGIKALNGASIMQRNCEDVNSVDGDISDHLETSSSISGELSDTINFSTDVDLLISKE
ncbi:hypothetical protein Patl1_24584 [Pistacia atlantica]|uniref:Uncharacterized protein n=1 Tax=Pistacia atlantica TaxID=434234 RepID=A0ACC1A236_9ROSI|nr:hypothetical protein Patl1_24584 [Pistacia atlantica]